MPLVPAPREGVRCAAPALDLGSQARFVVTGDANDVAKELATLLGVEDGEGPTIALEVEGPASDPAKGPPVRPEEESFEITIREGVWIHARTKRGLRYAAQTLGQLAGTRVIERRSPGAAATPRAKPARTLPCISLRDSPRYGVRVMHLDVARHFFDRKVVERYIDLLAFYRFNVFHGHLTDHQGFSFETKTHSELTRG